MVQTKKNYGNLTTRYTQYSISFHNEKTHRFGPFKFTSISPKNTVCQDVLKLLVPVVYRPTQNFSLIWSRHHYQWRAANFDLHSALMAIEQCGFCTCNSTHEHMTTFKEPWHSYLIKLSLPVLIIYVCLHQNLHTHPTACVVIALTNSSCTALCLLKFLQWFGRRYLKVVHVL